MATNSPRKTRPIEAVKNTFSIVEYLHHQGRSDLSEMNAHLDMAKSTIYKHLSTLEQEKWVMKINGEYFLSYRFLTVGGAVRDRTRLCSTVHPKLREFSREVGRLGMFSVIEKDEGTFIFRINDTIGVAKGIPVGTRYSLHKNAAGKAMLAELPDKRISKIIETQGLEAETSNTITNEDKLYEDIKRVRKRGYAVNKGERKEQLNAVACTVTDHGRDSLGAISICGPASDLPEERLHELGPRTRILAEEIELQIKFG